MNHAENAGDVIRLAAARAPIVEAAEEYDLEALNAEFAVILVGQKAMVLHLDPEARPGDPVRLLTMTGFKDWLSNRRYIEWKGARDPKPVHRPVSKRWLEDSYRREYRGLVFEPGDDADPGTAFNLWKGFAVAPDPAGDATPLLRHLFMNVCGEREELFDYVVAWFAHMVQRPRERIGTAIALRGGQGTGKTMVGKIFGSLIEAHYLLVDDPRYLLGQFNAHLAQTLFLQADEAFWSGDKAGVGHLKGLITSDTQMIEHKGVDPIKVRNYLRLMVTSNEDWVVPAGRDERRWLMIDVGADRAQDSGYFGALHAHFFGEHGERNRGALLHHLLRFDLSTVDLRTPPRTQALYEQKVRSLDPVEAWWLERLMDGGQLPGEPWLERVPKFRVLASYHKSAERSGVRFAGTETQFGIALKRICSGINADLKCSSSIGQDLEDPAEPSRTVRAYTFPPLAECRALFVLRLGQPIEWPPE